MRLILYMRADADSAYDSSYHNKLRGRMWRAFENKSWYEERHDNGDPLGLTFSNPFPPKNISKGDSMKLLVAGVSRDLLNAVAKNLREYPQIHIGQMKFTVEDMDLLNPDVGPPGSSGTIKTSTGVICRFNDAQCEQYGIEKPEDATQEQFWQPEHTVGPFFDRVIDNLDYKHQLFEGEDLPGPRDRDTQLFTDYTLTGMHAVPLTVTENVTVTQVMSKWEFKYEIQDSHHRRHLNLLFDAGLGERSGYGFGFINPVNA